MYAIGIDIGGTNLKCVAAVPDGAVLLRATEPTEEASAHLWAERILAWRDRAATEQGEPAAGVGIAAPGLPATDGRSIAWMQGRMAAVQGLDWTERLELGQEVPVLNDAQAALLGEAWIGAAAGSRNAILLTLGTGVGGAILCDGHLLKGAIGRAGHLGHLCLDPDAPLDIVNTPGSLEDAIGDCTIRERTGGRFDATEALVAAAQAGDSDAAQVWQRSLHVLACAIVSIVNAVDPEVVVIGGGIARAGDALFGPLNTALDRLEWRPLGDAARVRLVPAVLGEYAGALGAARNALLRLASGKEITAA